MSLDTFVVVLVSGLSGAALLFLVSAGLTLVFGALRLINMAHGSLYMLGAFLAVAFLGTLSGALGFAGGILAASLAVGGSTVSVYQLFLIGVAVTVAAGLWSLLYRTSLGRDVRAAVADPELLRLAGVNVRLLFTTVFLIGALLAGLAGAVIAPYHAVSLGIDVDIVVQAFAVTIIGGLGSLTGAVVGSLLVGLVQSFGIYAAPKFSLAFIFIVLAAVLGLRPWGLFGEPER